MRSYRANTPSRRHCVLLTLAIVLSLFLGCVRSASAEPAPDIAWAAIDAYIEAQMDEQRIPGLALGIVQGDRVVRLAGFGVADPRGEPVTAQTAFSIGSLTKSFTAVAIMQLVEAGQVELDSPVRRYLPWFGVADQDASVRITVRDLLYHTSGLPRDFESPDAGRMKQGPEALEQRLRNLRTVQLEQPIGTYGYSNVGYQVLAMVIQQVTGQLYDNYMRQHIFTPLNMRQSHTSIDEVAQRPMATGYHYWFGLPVASPFPLYRTGPGNGGLFSCAEGMAHYLIAHFHNGHTAGASLLSEGGLAELHRPGVERPGGMYAMGWGVRTSDGMTTLSHRGVTYNYFATMTLEPERGWGVVVLQNAQNTVKLLAGNTQQSVIADGVLRLLVGQQPPAPPRNTMLWVVYGVFCLVIVIQIVGMWRSIMTFRRWQKQPNRRPQGARELAW